MRNCFATLEALRERPLAPHMLELIEGMEALAATLQPPANGNIANVTAISKRPFSWSTEPASSLKAKIALLRGRTVHQTAPLRHESCRGG